MIWGLIILYMFATVGLLVSANMHGKKKEGNHNFWGTAIGHILQFTLIWWALGWRFG